MLCDSNSGSSYKQAWVMIHRCAPLVCVGNMLAILSFRGVEV